MDWKKLLSELRAKGWTQQLIANRVGASQASVSDLYRGKTTNPTYELARSIELLHESGELPVASEAKAA